MQIGGIRDKPIDAINTWYRYSWVLHIVQVISGKKHDLFQANLQVMKVKQRNRNKNLKLIAIDQRPKATDTRKKLSCHN